MANPSVPGSAMYSAASSQYESPGSSAPSAPVHGTYGSAPTGYGVPTSPVPGAYGPGTYGPERGGPSPVPGAYAPGAYQPAAPAPGAYAPGASAPGANTPGGYAPGAYAPGASAPGANAPGGYAPGAYVPGGPAPGAYAPSAYAPGVSAPGAYAPGTYAPASTSSGGTPAGGSAPSSYFTPPVERGIPTRDEAMPGSTGPGSAPTVPVAPGVAVPFRDPGAANQVAPGTTSCPPGLEYLTLIEQVVVQQQVELTEAFLGIEMCNVYEAKNSLGQLIYTIKETSGCCARCCCGPRRCLELDVLDYMKTVVMHIERPLRCVHCCWFCCLQTMEVQAPPGTTIAFIRQRWSICHPYFTIYTPEDEPALNIVGPICTESCPCKCDVKFEVITMNGVTIGGITKEWGGLVKEYFTDADTFNVYFPLDLDVRMKAALLASAMLIDYMFFEEAYKRKDDRAPGMVG